MDIITRGSLLASKLEQSSGQPKNLIHQACFLVVLNTQACKLNNLISLTDDRRRKLVDR